MIPVWPYFEASGAFAGGCLGVSGDDSGLALLWGIRGLCRRCPEMTPAWPNSALADLILGLKFQEVSKNDSGSALF